MTIDLDKRALELLDAQLNDVDLRLGYDGSPVVTRDLALIAIKAALSESTRPAIDLGQFREAVELLKEAAVSKAKAHEYMWGSPTHPWQREGLALAEADRLLALIDAQSVKSKRIAS